MNIPPMGKIQSTINGLKMHRIDNWVFDITADVRLGGRYASRLEGLTPRTLVPLGILDAEPPPHFVLPAYTQDSAAARRSANWRQ